MHSVPPSPPQRRNLKKILLTLLQLGITAGILWLVFHDPAKRSAMLGAIRNASPLWLLLGIGVYGAVEVVAAVRWHLLLCVQGIRLPGTRLARLLMIGVFFNFFVPGGTGGDLVKTFYLLKETPGKAAQALLSVLVDRIIGVLALVILAGVFTGLRWDWLTAYPETARYTWAGLAILAISFSLIACTLLLSGLGLVHKLPAKMPGRERLAEVALAYNAYARAWRPVLGAFLLSIAAHLGYFTTFYCAARALAGNGVVIPSLTELFAILPVLNTILCMPISFGGVGVREGLFEIFLGHLCQVTAPVAVVISSTGYLLSLFWGLVGGVLYIFYRPSEHAGMQEMTSTVEALDHELAESELAREAADDPQP